MALFRRQSATPSTHPVTDFWTWWNETGRTMSPHEPSSVTKELDRRLQSIEEGLAWHFGHGTVAEHRLTVSSGGVAELRSAAERWLRAAPPADSTWEFRSSQEADPSAMENVLEIGGQKLELSAIQFGIETDLDRRRVHVSVFHPTFGDLKGDLAQQVTFLVLDWVLGEDTVERWVGAVDSVTTPPSNAGTDQDLRSAVDQLEAEREDDTWAIAEFVTEAGKPGMAMFRTDIRWIDLPTYDLYHRVTTTYSGQGDGRPSSADLDGLRELEDAIRGSISERGVLVAHDSAEGMRRFHVYTDGEDQNVTEALVTAVTRPGVTLESDLDPSWQAVRQFTG